MRALFWIVGLIAASFSALHWFITYEHWHQIGPHRESVFIPACAAALTAVIAVWCFRRAAAGARSA